MKTKLTYEEKKRIADNYLYSLIKLYWYNFPNINSLNNANSQYDIIGLCDERLSYIEQ